jgi:hypothetical protein
VDARSRLLIIGSALALLATPANAEEIERLYRASAIVTGQDNLPERARGTREAMAAVLAKVSADAEVAKHAAAALADAESYVVSRSYRDRKAGVQISDEQGTRERSFVLEVAFDRVRIDALLRSLGREPWTGKRPALRVELRVTDAAATYLVTQTSERGWGHREAIRAIGEKAGLPVVLPQVEASAAPGADNLLSGNMTMTRDGYWVTEWRLSAAGSSTQWTVPATTFDRAIAQGVWTAARRLAQALTRAPPGSG